MGETDVQVETVGKPCPPGPGGKPAEPGDWSEWGPCSESCKQGTRSRTRDSNGLEVHEKETKPCYATCDQGPCKSTTCADKPGAVCTVNGTKPPARPEKETLNFSRRTLVKRNQRAAAESGTSRSSRMSKAARLTVQWTWATVTEVVR